MFSKELTCNIKNLCSALFDWQATSLSVLSLINHGENTNTVLVPSAALLSHAQF